jgi:hypothetical protein
MAYPLYDYRASTVALAMNPAFTLILSSNIYRICAILSSLETTGMVITDRKSTNGTGSLGIIPAQDYIVLPYRDYGPAIQHEIWGAMIAAVSGNVNVIEVFSIPKG